MHSLLVTQLSIFENKKPGKLKIYNLIFYSTLVMVMYMSVTPLSKEDNKITGAWKSISGSEKAVIIMEDGYLTLTKYDTASNKFLITKGGKYKVG